MQSAGIAALMVVSAAALNPQPAQLGQADQSQLQQNLDRGQALYRYDQSAWHVSDAARAALSESSGRLVRGWITTPAPNGLRTTFYGEADGSYFALYSAVWTGSSIADPKVYEAAERQPVPDEERLLILARNVALESQTQFAMCNSARPNIIVIPGETATAHVYVMTPQVEHEIYPLGGHHRIDVASGKVVSKRSFTNSCIDLQRAGADGDAAGLMVTHLLDPIPTEIHVFTAFATKVPVFVGMKDGRIFAVEATDGTPTARLVSE